MITLYDFDASADCYKLRLLLAMLKLDHVLVPVDIHPGNDHRQPAFLDLNPLGEVPVLTDGDVTLTELPAILVWLAARYDASGEFLPKEPERLAAVTQWLSLSTRLAASIGAARWSLAKTEEINLSPLQAEGRRLLRVIDEHLWFAERGGGDWLLPGPQPSLADIACFPDLALCEEAGILLLEFPAIRRWLDRVKRIPGFVPMAGIFPAAPGK
jgi:glutathione S-transferase